MGAENVANVADTTVRTSDLAVSDLAVSMSGLEAEGLRGERIAAEPGTVDLPTLLAKVPGVQPSPAPLIDLQFIYDTAPIGLAFLSPDCRYLYINQRLTEICGISVVDHIGRTVREMVPNVAEQVEKLVRYIIETGQSVTGIEVNGQRTDKVGADRCWLTSWHPLKNADGRILGVNVAAEEITERKRAQAALTASERRYRALVQSTTSLVWTTTAEGEFINSPEWRAFTGQSLAEVRGSLWFNAVHPYDRDSARMLWATSIKKRTPYEAEYRIRRRDGVYVWHQVRANAVLEDDGSVREWVGVCVDVDHRKQAAEKQELFNRSVEQALDLLVKVSAGASDALTVADVASACLERICNAHRWQFAQVWYPDNLNGRLTCSAEFSLERRPICRISPRQRWRRDRGRRGPSGPRLGYQNSNLVRGYRFRRLSPTRARPSNRPYERPRLSGHSRRRGAGDFRIFFDRQASPEPHHSRRGRSTGQNSGRHLGSQAFGSGAARERGTMAFGVRDVDLGHPAD